MTTRTRNNIIGRNIYERIKHLSNIERKEYLKNVSTDYNELYKKYNNVESFKSNIARLKKSKKRILKHNQ